ncbi:MAG TPA: 50S ribosomal protein L18 [Planctomycetaceae bacterium]|nr:50S ribosomal protein L18 [Planctomycetaceae bacterium]|tara:strand:+ start:1093 stop:1461 length:369 start_codon:yes stop_codon:yes gene_type:complete
MNRQKYLEKQRQRRRYHVRHKLRGSAEQPRLSVDRSLTNIGGQLIDDAAGSTLISVHSQEKSVRGEIKVAGNCDAAAIVGKLLAERALAAGIKKIRFDRGHGKYHGRIAALANAARENGLEF